MDSGVQIAGIQQEMGGHRESQAMFHKHHKAVGDALLNISEGRDKDDPRPEYVKQSWPKHVYHADGRDMVVADQDDLRAAKGEGFRAEPYPKVRIALGDPAAEKKAMLDTIQEQNGKIAVLTESLNKLLAAQKDSKG